MAIIDAHLQYFIFNVILPAVVIFFIIRWYFDLKLVKVRTWIEYKCMKWTHSKLEKEKRLLFGHMERFKNSLGKNPRLKSALNILEIGVGAGRNFCFYPKKSLVTCLDSNPHQESYVRESIKNASRKLKFVRFVTGFAEEMKNVESNSFDVVVCTMTLCMVQDTDATLEEIRRVLKPGGKFFFLEYVAAPKSSLARWIQNKLQRVWAYILDGGCINRETWVHFDHSDFSEVSYEHFKGSLWFGPMRTMIYGTVTK